MARRARLVGQGVAIGLVALLFALLGWSLLTGEGGTLAAQANRGERPTAPDFTLERLDDEGELLLSSFEGKAVLVNFWASWCIPCKDEAPFLEEVWRDNRNRGLVVVGPGDNTDPYGVTGFPETFVIDREGKVVAAFKGGVDGDDVRPEVLAAIEQALET